LETQPGPDVNEGGNLPAASWLLRADVPELRKPVKPVEQDEEQDHFAGIRCPLCRWRPTAESRWRCVAFGTPEPPFDACGTVWNTFSTRGRCPGCDHQWRWTTCPRCEEYSLHEDWYEERTDPGA
jgi:hypothetical protein